MLEKLETRVLLTTASASGGLLTINGTTGAETIDVGLNDAGRVTISGVGSTFAGITSIRVNANSGNDTVIISTAITLPTTINGGNGNDTLRGGDGPDQINGEGNDDRINGRDNADRLSGGSGFDTADYSGFTQNVKIDLDTTNSADDGRDNGGEGDQVGVISGGLNDIENIESGSGNDNLIGDSKSNFISGGAGNDTIDGGGGNDNLVGLAGFDTFKGQAGDDFLFAQFNDTDSLSGGDGTDTGTRDDPDIGDTFAATFALMGPMPLSVVGDNAGDLDASFDQNGLFGWSYSGFSWAEAVAVQSDGKVVVAGNVNNYYGDSDFAILRLNADGTLDSTFGEIIQSGVRRGYRLIDIIDGDGFARVVAIDSQGNIVVAGEASAGEVELGFAVAKLDPNGDLLFSRAFGSGDGEANAVEIDANDNILLAGYYDSDFAVARLTPDGLLDTTFGELTPTVGVRTGVAITDFGYDYDGTPFPYDITIQDDGKILVAGGGIPSIVSPFSDSDFAVVRYDTSGDEDPNFGNGGTQVVDFGDGYGTEDIPYGVRVDEDGNVILAGASDNNLGVVILDANGQPLGENISPFGPNYDIIETIAFSPDGKIVAGGVMMEGDSSVFAVQRYLADGRSDESFAGGGPATTDFGFSPYRLEDVAIDHDGNILAAGVVDVEGEMVLAVARFLGQDRDTEQPPEDLIDPDVEITEPTQTDVNNRIAGLPSYIKSYALTTIDVNGCLEIEGTSGNDAIDLQLGTQLIDGDEVAVIKVTYNGTIIDVPVEGLNCIEINGNNGNDRITVGNDITLPSTINGGEGHDIINAGGGDDEIDTGSGNNLVFARDGHDMVRGGSGLDVIFGGEGDDWLYGGAGSDALEGGNGLDHLFGESGRDLLYSRDGGQPDELDGGDDRDTALVDAADTYASIEQLLA